MSTNSSVRSFMEKKLTVNEFVVLTAVKAASNHGRLEASSNDIAATLGGELSRHAVNRALRNLHDRNWINYTPKAGGRPSVIEVIN